MYYLESPSTDPFFNIATEECLLRERNEEFFILYVDQPSIIVGKHQNTLAEVNYKYVIENNVPVIRRISGGGTVYHDLGNLNFCVIANSREGYQIDFRKYIQPVVDTLIREYDIPAEMAGKNDIRVNGLKISGNAEHVYKNRVLHHGTLLVNSDLQNLSAALKVTPGKYIDNAVKSIRSKVENLNSFNKNINISDLKAHLKKQMSLIFNIENYELSDNEVSLIKRKIEDKFSTWEWNYAYSPAYKFKNEDIELQVENGLITKAALVINDLETSIIGKAHNYLTLNELSKEVWIFF